MSKILRENSSSIISIFAMLFSQLQPYKLVKKLFPLLILLMNLVHAQTPIDSLNVTPNPFQKRTCAVYSFSQNDTVSLIIYNNIGQTILNPKSDVISGSGYYQDSLIMDSYPDGIYFTHLKLGKRKTIVKKIIKTSCPSSLNMFATNGPISCLGACDATATVISFSGAPPYSYFWKPISINTATASGLCAGVYTIIGTDFNNCIDSTALIINNPSNPCVGINESFVNLKNFKVYPNPVSNILHIESEIQLEAETEIEITNTLGQTVLKQGFNKEIDLASLSSGYYILKVISAMFSMFSMFLMQCFQCFQCF